MGVFLFAAGFVVVLVARMVHEVEFVDEAAVFQHFESAVDGDTVELGVLEAGEVVEAFGVEMFAGILEEVEEDAALAGEPDAPFFESFPDALAHSHFRFRLSIAHHGAKSAASRRLCPTIGSYASHRDVWGNHAAAGAAGI